jgi:hypothetical protein
MIKLFNQILKGMPLKEQLKLQTKIIGQSTYCKILLNKHLLN